MRQGWWCSVAAFLLAAGGGGRAEAAGYALREQSALALGNAFAGATAGAESLSYMFFNPAALARLDGYGVELALSAVAPRVELKDATASTGAGTPVDGDDDDGDIAEDVLVPAIYGMVPLGERVRLGLGVSVPFGLETDYDNEWVGRYHALRSRVQAFNINPAIGVQLTDWLSAGFGAQIQYIDGKLENAVDFGTIGAGFGLPGSVPGAQDGRAELEGDDWGAGFTAGLLLEPVQGTRLGVAYRSKIDHQLDGDANFTDDTAGIAATLRGLSGAFADSDASLDLTTPATLSFGIHQDITPRFAVMGEVAWTEWSEFEELRVEFDNPAQPDSFTEQEWNDSWFYALGATFKATDSLTFRAGVAYDQSPVKDGLRTPRIPDEDRYWLAFGASWQPRSWIGVDLGYTHIWVNDAELDLFASDPGNAARGDLTAKYDVDIDIVTLGLRFVF